MAVLINPKVEEDWRKEEKEASKKWSNYKTFCHLYMKVIFKHN